MRLQARGVLVVSAALGVALSACSSSPDVAEISPGDREIVGTTSSAITATDALARAQEWVVAKVPYCQSANHQPDGDPACSSTCTRPNNPQWDAYRSDCSGFLSWAWGLPAPGRTTFELAPAVTDITHVIDPATLAPGDAVNLPHHHTMLFVKWITQGTRATFQEEPGCSSSTPYAHQVDSNVTISGMSITVAVNGETFSAIRFNAISAQDAGAAPPDAGSTPPPDAGSGAHDSGSTAQDSGGPSPAHDAGAPSGDGGGAGNGKGNDAPPNGGGTDTFAPGQSGGCSVASTRARARIGPRDDGAPALPFMIAGVVIAAARRRRRARSLKD